MRILITGATGQLGGYLLREANRRRLNVVAWSGSHAEVLFGSRIEPVPIENFSEVQVAFEKADAEVLIHAAAIASIAECHRHPEKARQVNVLGTEHLVTLARAHGCRFIYVSTDLVFDGVQGNYVETDSRSPLSLYGKSKAEAEDIVLRASNTFLVSRLSLMYGPTLVGRPYFFDQQVQALREGNPIVLFQDEWRTPLDLATAATALLDLASSKQSGVIHIGGPERMSRAEFGVRLASFLGANPAKISAVNRTDVPAPEPRPADCSLNSTRWRQRFPGTNWPRLEEALVAMDLPCE